MLYRVETNLPGPGYNFFLYPAHDGVMRNVFFRNREKSIEVTPSGLPIRIFNLRSRVDEESINKPFELLTSSGGKDPDVEKFPDFYTAEITPVVTEKFKEFISKIDPDIHQFVPFTVYKRNTREPYEEPTFYRFICGRFIDVPRHEEPLKETMSDIKVPPLRGFPGIADEFHYLRSIFERPDIQSAIEQYPLWQLYRGGNVRPHFANKAFMKGVKEHGLKGFKESSKIKIGRVTKRDVSHVFY